MIEAIATITAFLTCLVVIGAICKVFVSGYIGDENER